MAPRTIDTPRAVVNPWPPANVNQTPRGTDNPMNVDTNEFTAIRAELAYLADAVADLGQRQDEDLQQVTEDHARIADALTDLIDAIEEHCGVRTAPYLRLIKGTGPRHAKPRSGTPAPGQVADAK